MKSITLLRKLLGIAALAAPLLAGASQAQTLVVGGKNFTEQQILAELTTQLLEKHGITVQKRDGMGSTVLRTAQENGQVDVYWEYTGTSLITYNKIQDRLSAEDTYQKVKTLDAAKGLVWLNPSKANSTYALAMNRDQAQQLGIATISDLARVMGQGTKLTFGSNAEFYARADGFKPLSKAYGLDFPRDAIKRMDTGLTYTALKNRQIDIALVFATDGRIPAFDFVVLQDDQRFFPSYALTPVVRQAVLDANPQVAEWLNKLSHTLDDATMARLNASVDVDKQAIQQVAHDYLASNNLI
ncbi:glycine betaine ABC transporter substrate-binding protein [Bordetella sp. BOR01]|uniref:glycine betaine ABC transporter substrate-binding protein n=1 Tax=Bordetella sp. BOR01 TaxID=2854779 RepID=UPI001C437B9C|nr:glycine betaine ABC transporter substrate-binding protein [Bordetella sp. BOR01]MBV7486552.1 glycine betaine ABC transporter substrate-binding protein [Bordetella sp. BOR01]